MQLATGFDRTSFFPVYTAAMVAAFSVLIAYVQAPAVVVFCLFLLLTSYLITCVLALSGAQKLKFANSGGADSSTAGSLGLVLRGIFVVSFLVSSLAAVSGTYSSLNALSAPGSAGSVVTVSSPPALSVPAPAANTPARIAGITRIDRTDGRTDAGADELDPGRDLAAFDADEPPETAAPDAALIALARPAKQPQPDAGRPDTAGAGTVDAEAPMLEEASMLEGAPVLLARLNQGSGADVDEERSQQRALYRIAKLPPHLTLPDILRAILYGPAAQIDPPDMVVAKRGEPAAARNLVAFVNTPGETFKNLPVGAAPVSTTTLAALAPAAPSGSRSRQVSVASEAITVVQKTQPDLPAEQLVAKLEPAPSQGPAAGTAPSLDLAAAGEALFSAQPVKGEPLSGEPLRGQVEAAADAGNLTVVSATPLAVETEDQAPVTVAGPAVSPALNDVTSTAKTDSARPTDETPRQPARLLPPVLASIFYGSPAQVEPVAAADTKPALAPARTVVAMLSPAVETGEPMTVIGKLADEETATAPKSSRGTAGQGTPAGVKTLTAPTQDKSPAEAAGGGAGFASNAAGLFGLGSTGNQGGLASTDLPKPYGDPVSDASYAMSQQVIGEMINNIAIGATAPSVPDGAIEPDPSELEAAPAPAAGSAKGSKIGAAAGGLEPQANLRPGTLSSTTIVQRREIEDTNGLTSARSVALAALGASGWLAGPTELGRDGGTRNVSVDQPPVAQPAGAGPVGASGKSNRAAAAAPAPAPAAAPDNEQAEAGKADPPRQAGLSAKARREANAEINSALRSAEADLKDADKVLKQINVIWSEHKETKRRRGDRADLKTPSTRASSARAPGGGTKTNRQKARKVVVIEPAAAVQKTAKAEPPPRAAGTDLLLGYIREQSSLNQYGLFADCAVLGSDARLKSCAGKSVTRL